MKKYVYILIVVFSFIVSLFIINAITNKNEVSNDFYYKYKTIYGEEGITTKCDIDRQIGDEYCIINGNRVLVEYYLLDK